MSFGPDGAAMHLPGMDLFCFVSFFYALVLRVSACV